MVESRGKHMRVQEHVVCAWGASAFWPWYSVDQGIRMHAEQQLHPCSENHARLDHLTHQGLVSGERVAIVVQASLGLLCMSSGLLCALCHHGSPTSDYTIGHYTAHPRPAWHCQHLIEVVLRAQCIS
eukprot:1155895-Pelagomonas_calceolata.AAC.4